MVEHQKLVESAKEDIATAFLKLLQAANTGSPYGRASSQALIQVMESLPGGKALASDMRRKFSGSTGKKKSGSSSSFGTKAPSYGNGASSPKPSLIEDSPEEEDIFKAPPYEVKEPGKQPGSVANNSSDTDSLNEKGGSDELANENNEGTLPPSEAESTKKESGESQGESKAPFDEKAPPYNASSDGEPIPITELGKPEIFATVKDMDSAQLTSTYSISELRHIAITLNPDTPKANSKNAVAGHILSHLKK